MSTKRKYYLLSSDVINHIKIEALKANVSEHNLVNKILSSYKTKKMEW